MKQEEVNKTLVNICKIAKTIGQDYIEYIAAILLIAYTSEKYEITYWNKYQEPKDIIRYLDTLLRDTIIEFYSRYEIFYDFKFENKNYGNNDMIFKEIVKEVKELFSSLRQDDKKEAKISNGYIHIIDYYLQEKTNAEYGELCTPEQVINLLSNLIKKDENVESMYEPAYGSASFLATAMKNIKTKKIIINQTEKQSWKKNVSLVNLILSGAENIEFKTENRDRFDIIITNPPFAGRNLEKTYYKYVQNEYEYVLEMIDKLTPNGKLNIILPQGAAFRKKDVDIRKYLIERSYIDAVIQLPENIFYGAKNSVIILLIRNNKSNNDILFINASNEFKKQKKTNILTQENVDKIIDTYKKYQDVDNFAHVAKIEEIKENEFDLSVQKYVKKMKNENIEEINLNKLYEDILEEQRKIIEIEKEFQKMIKK